MRDYRGKTKEGELVKGFYLRYFYKEGAFGASYILPYGSTLDEMKQVIPETVGQFTGQKDKNKTKAYKGDIIEHDGKFYEIKWDDEGMAFYCDGNDWIDDAKLIRRSVIVGTIHDNPELLK